MVGFSQLISTLVGEIVLSCKEVNQKSRVAANEALVSIAHAMHENNPPTLESGTGTHAVPPQCLNTHRTVLYQCPSVVCYCEDGPVLLNLPSAVIAVSHANAAMPVV
jgi:hypothetical protein